MRILIVEDEPKTAAYARKGLTEHGFVVDVAENGVDGRHLAMSSDYDLVVLDVMLPGVDGWTVLRDLREKKPTPVLFLTARDGVADRVKGLELGADDYLVKPFAFAELVVRVRALCRREQPSRPSVLRAGDLELDLPRRRVTRAGVLLSLSAKEFAVLELLMLRAGEVVTRSELIESCWDEASEPMSNVVDVLIGQLRRRLGPPDPIATVRGVGYRLGGEA